MLIGAHSIIYSKKPEADRAFLRDVLQLPSVDVGEGWLIFGLPPAEVAVHPSNKNDVHEFYLMCDDVESLVAALKKRNVACGPVHNLGWGVLTHVKLPGGGQLGIYQPRHARPKAMAALSAAKSIVGRTAKRSNARATKSSAGRAAKGSDGRAAKQRASTTARKTSKKQTAKR